MASSTVHSNKMRRLQSKKSHSWWWDSHINPKNSKWLAENLETMDQSVRRMLKLIEEDADSFSRKVEMYYQKRPELISLVEEFYRMYRSLAERYDNVTGELRKNIASDLQSQGSGFSDVGSDAPPSTCPSPSPEQRASRRRPGPRAAGFDFFLGSGTSGSDVNQKEGDETSTLTDSESESDDSSVNNYSVLSGNSGDQGLNRKVIELEIEPREMREKLKTRQDEDQSGSPRGRGNDVEELVARISGYEQELTVANERTRVLGEEVNRLNLQLETYKSSEFTNREAGMEFDRDQALQKITWDSNSRVQELTEQLRITNERLQSAEKQIDSLKHQLDSGGPSDKVNKLQEQLASAHKDINTWKTKLNAEKREVSKLQERIARLKSSLSDRDHEVRELMIAVSDAELKIFPEKARIKAEICRLSEERTRREEQLKEWESRGRLLEDEIRRVQAQKNEIEGRLGHEIERFKVEIAGRDDRIQNLDKCLAAMRWERDQLNMKILALEADKASGDNRISEMDKDLQQLQMQHRELVCSAAEARKLVDDLRLKIKDLEEEVTRQREAIMEGAEEKREAIRQLCLSIEHYRSSYNGLRQAFMGYKRIPVLAS